MNPDAYDDYNDVNSSDDDDSPSFSKKKKTLARKKEDLMKSFRVHHRQTSKGLPPAVKERDNKELPTCSRVQIYNIHRKSSSQSKLNRSQELLQLAFTAVKLSFKCVLNNMHTNNPIFMLHLTCLIFIKCSTCQHLLECKSLLQLLLNLSLFIPYPHLPIFFSL